MVTCGAAGVVADMVRTFALENDEWLLPLECDELRAIGECCASCGAVKPARVQARRSRPTPVGGTRSARLRRPCRAARLTMRESPDRAALPVAVRRELPAEPASVAKARRMAALVGAVPPTALSDARLVISELVTNAVTHAGLGRDDVIEIRLTRLERRLRIDVDDRRGFPAVPGAQTLRSQSRGGRLGLRIVTSLAVHWHATDGCVTAWIAI
jgi:anti-sigma regulatory factor (Ser/Thr protein kinase)